VVLLPISLEGQFPPVLRADLEAEGSQMVQHPLPQFFLTQRCLPGRLPSVVSWLY